MEWYVVRGGNGAVRGLFSCAQTDPNNITDPAPLPDDHPEVLAFLNPPKDYAQLRREEYNKRGVTIEAIAEAIIEKEGGRLDKLQALMMIRDAVRIEVPKI